MILKYEISEESCKNSYICVFLFFFDNSIYSKSFFLLNFVWFKFLNDPLNKIPRAATDCQLVNGN